MRTRPTWERRVKDKIDTPPNQPLQQSPAARRLSVTQRSLRGAGLLSWIVLPGRTSRWDGSVERCW